MLINEVENYGHWGDHWCCRGALYEGFWRRCPLPLRALAHEPTLPPQDGGEVKTDETHPTDYSR